MSADLISLCVPVATGGGLGVRLGKEGAEQIGKHVAKEGGEKVVKEVAQEGGEALAKTGSKVDNVKNPLGAAGKPDHQALVEQLAAKAERENPGCRILTGKKIQIEGSNRRPDVQVIDPKTEKSP